MTNITEQVINAVTKTAHEISKKNGQWAGCLRPIPVYENGVDTGEIDDDFDPELRPFSETIAKVTLTLGCAYASESREENLEFAATAVLVLLDYLGAHQSVGNVNPGLLLDQIMVQSTSE